jgi:hypothetical protein
MKVLPNAHPELVIFDTNADKLVASLTALLDKLHEPYRRLYQN